MHSQISTTDRKHTRAAGFVAIAALVLNAAWGLINLVSGGLVIGVENLAVAAAFGATYIANQLGFHSGAAVSIALLFLVHQGFALYLFGYDSGVYLYYLLGIIAPFLIFRRSDLLAATAFAIVFGAAFFACVFWQEQLPARFAIGSSDSMERINALFVLATLLAMTAFFVLNVNAGEDALEAANSRINGLLRTVLPEAIAERLTANPDDRIADYFDCVSVAFLDVVEFTAKAAMQHPVETITMLDKLFSAFDLACQTHGVLKIKTIGDGYMFATGIPQTQSNHQIKIIEAGLEFIRIAQEQGLTVRIGAHCGEAIAGVIGVSRFQYDILGDTVNVAARMEASGQVGAIQVTDVMHSHIQHDFPCEPRGPISVKGKGQMNTWLVSADLQAASTSQ